MLPLAVLWVDPGKMTGLAYLSIAGQQPGHRFGALELPFQEACLNIDSMCQGWGSSLAIGWERFTITSRTYKLTPQPDALHVIGVCRYLAGKHGCRVLPEAPQATPGAAEQAQLRAIGWWQPGKDDAQSAAAHLLRYCVKTGNVPPGLAARLQGEGL